MTDEDALLAAVLAAPDDDTPRLVYADWLDEHGQPDRAEFIPVQIELERQCDAERHSYLRNRESHLLRGGRKRWLRPFHDRLPSSRFTFRREFVQEIDTNATLYLRVVGELHRLAPIREVVVHRATGLCDLNRMGWRPGVRLRAVVREGMGLHYPPTELDLLRPNPPELEPHLRTGRWVVFVWSIWSGPDRVAVLQLGQSLHNRRWPSTGIRPMDDYAEIGKWCPAAPEYQCPLWLGLRDGELVSYHVGLDPPDERRYQFWDHLR